jgi:LacI family transcriptional regulator
MTTIVDVARLAGVSVSTVSHVVNGTKPVGAETRRRVVHAIEATGYQAHGLARALRRSRTESIGLVVSDTGQEVFADMIRGVEQEARAAGFTLLLANSAEDRDLEVASIRALRERRVDGLLLAHVARSSPDLVRSIQQDGLPIVLIDRLSIPEVDQVGVENSGPMKVLVRHLIDLGHRRIALIAGDVDVPTLAERMVGYVDAFQEAQLPLDLGLMVTGRGLAPDSYAAATALLSAAHPPTAIVSASMLMSVATLQAARDRGLTVPADIAIATFDAPAYADLFTPRLTSVVQPAFQIGREGMRLLLRRIRQPDAPVRTVRLRPRIVHRESCGCPPDSTITLEEAA